MVKINIQGLTDINDAFYRYKMEKLNVIRQRTKTIIDNLDLVSKDLDRDINILIDYLKKKLNITLFYKNNLLTMSADIPYEKFELYLREFIEIYVLCEKCKLPETILKINNNKVLLDCKCCSYKTIRNIKK